MAKIPNIFLIGPMGAGKSTIGRQLAKELKMDFYDSDQEVEAKTGVDITWIFDMEGEAGFRKREAGVIDELTQKQNIILATGGGSILLKENRNALAARGIVIYLEASLEQQMERTEYDRNRPLLQTERPREEILKEFREIREPLYAEIADVSFKTDGNSVRSVASEILDYIYKQQEIV